MAGTNVHRTLAIAVLSGLLAGFVYSGVATAREYGKVFRAPRVTGRAATIDALLAPAGLTSAQEVRRAAARAGWPLTEDVMVEVTGTSLSPQDIQQIYVATGYLLYPRRVWLKTPGTEPGAGPRPGPSPAARHVILIGRGHMEWR